MLGIVSANGARLSAGSMGLALGQRWSESGERVLLIDVDTATPALAERFGAATRAEYSPETRGLPSLIAAREPLTLKSLAEHCYSLDSKEGSRWALFGPSHPGGARYASQWLAERSNELAEIDRQRNIIVTTSLQSGDESQNLLFKALPTIVVIAPVRSRNEAMALRSLCQEAGLLHDNNGGNGQKQVLFIEGESTGIGDNEAMGLTGIYVEGRLPLIDDDKLLRLQGSRKDKAFMREFDHISGYLLQLSGRDVELGRGASPSDSPAQAAVAGPSFAGGIGD